MIEGILFDLGGVLERVVAAPQIEEWTHGQIPAELFWQRWLCADSVRRFESGKIGPDEFASRVVDELGIHVDTETFLKGFGSWLAGPYDGAAELVESVWASGYKAACFSNSNAVHWAIMEQHQNTAMLFEANFPSHLLGICKPDREAFIEVAKRWGVVPEHILFLDDNEVNCQGARSAGMQAECVQEVAGARKALARLGIIRR